MDLFGPIRTTSLEEKRYGFVVIDDFLYFTWVLFLASKDEAFSAFSMFCRKILNGKGLSIVSIRSDLDTKFENKDFEN